MAYAQKQWTQIKKKRKILILDSRMFCAQLANDVSE